MKILVMPRPIEGVSREEMLQHAAAEIQAVWELYAQGICREFYTRANEPGRVVLMFESASIEAAQEALATLPFAQLHLIDFDLIPLAPFTGSVGARADDEGLGGPLWSPAGWGAIVFPKRAARGTGRGLQIMMAFS